MNTPNDNRTATPFPVGGEGAGDPAKLDTVERLGAALTEASYTVGEVHRLTNVSETSIRRWLSEYPDSIYELKSPGEVGKHPAPLLVSFLELIEILVVGNIRTATGKKFAAIRQYHDSIAAEWETPFPFAHEDLSALAARGEKQLKPVVHTLKQMDYENGYVSLWYPMGKEQPITVDPRRGSGRPVVKGRRVRVQDIRGRFKSGESVEFIAYDFDLERTDVEAALRYALLVAS